MSSDHPICRSKHPRRKICSVPTFPYPTARAAVSHVISHPRNRISIISLIGSQGFEHGLNGTTGHPGSQDGRLEDFPNSDTRMGSLPFPPFFLSASHSPFFPPFLCLSPSPHSHRYPSIAFVSLGNFH